MSKRDQLEYNYIIRPKEFSKTKYLQKLIVYIDVEEINVEQLLNALFYDTVRLRNVTQGRLKEKFEDLVNLPDYFKGMSTNDLKSYFADMKKNFESEVKMFGINIPRANISMWGVLLIIAFQLYLLLHLTNLYENYPVPSNRDIPIYPSILCYSDSLLAKLCVYLTIVFLPLTAVIFGAGKILTSLERFGTLELYFLFTILISLILAHKLFDAVKRWYLALTEHSPESVVEQEKILISFKKIFQRK